MRCMYYVSTMYFFGAHVHSNVFRRPIRAKRPIMVLCQNTRPIMVLCRSTRPITIYPSLIKVVGLERPVLGPATGLYHGPRVVTMIQGIPIWVVSNRYESHLTVSWY